MPRKALSKYWRFQKQASSRTLGTLVQETSGLYLACFADQIEIELLSTKRSVRSLRFIDYATEPPKIARHYTEGKRAGTTLSS